MCLVFLLHYCFSTQSGSQSSVNHEDVDCFLVSQSVAHTDTSTPVNVQISSGDTITASSFTTPSSTPLPLELHIDEDGCSAVTTLSSKSFSYSTVQKKDEINGVVSSQVLQESVSKTSITVSPVAKSSSPVTFQSSSPGSTVKNSSPVVPSKSPSPVARSPSPAEKAPNQDQASKCPSPISHSPDVTAEKVSSPVTIPRLSSPVPQSASPVPIPIISSPLTAPKSASPERASPVLIPILSSPVPKISSPLTLPNISSPVAVPKSYSPDIDSKNTSIVYPRLSSPVTVPKSETPKNTPSVIRKTYTVPSASSPRASPISPSVPSSLACPPTEQKGGDILDLNWPCREPFLDDALDKLLAPSCAQLEQTGGNLPYSSILSGDEDGRWEEEDGLYPDFSREGTLTPMTESSWIDDCLTPSPCPGTPDASMELPTQQPSAVERLSASGQVGFKLESPKISCWHIAVRLLVPNVNFC